MEKKTKVVIIALSIVIVVLSGLTIWAFFIRDNNKETVVLTPDYAPHEDEKNAEPVDGSDEDKLSEPKGGGGVGLEYTKDVTISISGKTAEVYFANPGRSNQDMIVQIVIQDNIIVQSGKLSPGNRVTKLDLLDGAEKKLKKGTYEGKYVVLFYQQDSGEKAILNTEIPVSINVID